MVCRAICKPVKGRIKPSKCHCNTEAITSEATVRQVGRADIRASENTEGSDF